MGKKLKILYVDDEPINLMLFESFFRKNYSIHTTESPVIALELLNDSKDFDIIISDMNMPDMDGIELIQKTKEVIPDIRSFILTGYQINKQIIEALDNGLIEKYFKKPFDYREIEVAIIE